MTFLTKAITICCPTRRKPDSKSHPASSTPHPAQPASHAPPTHIPIPEPQIPPNEFETLNLQLSPNFSTRTQSHTHAAQSSSSSSAISPKFPPSSRVTTGGTMTTTRDLQREAEEMMVRTRTLSRKVSLDGGAGEGEYVSEVCFMVAKLGTAGLGKGGLNGGSNGMGGVGADAREVVGRTMRGVEEGLVGHECGVGVGKGFEGERVGERKWFVELRCWELLFPGEEELFPGKRPKRHVQTSSYCKKVVCEGCRVAGTDMRECPWVRLVSCPIFDHKKFLVRFGEESISPCPQCEVKVVEE